MAKKHCEHCGATMVEYKHGMSVPLIEGLTALNNAGGIANLKDLGLDRNQWDNFQKLRYWDLVEKHYEGGKRAGGTWSITQKGKDFLSGVLKINSRVVTYRGVRVKYLGVSVSAQEILENGYKQRIDYAEDSEPVNTKVRGL